MSKWTKYVKKVLFPPIWVVALLTLVSVGCLVCLVAYGQLLPVVNYCFYAVWAIWLTLFCCALPKIVKRVRLFVATNKMVQKYKTNGKFKLSVTLFVGTATSAFFCFVYLAMGIQQPSWWFFALLGYYFLLGGLRVMLLAKVRRNKTESWWTFVVCGAILFVTTLFLGLMVFLIVRANKGASYGYIATIAVATLTFSTTTLAIVNFVRYAKSKNPTVLATKAVSLATSLVSMLSLTTAMISAFGSAEDVMLRQITTATMGTAVCVFVTAMSLWMLVVGIRQLKNPTFIEPLA